MALMPGASTVIISAPTAEPVSLTEAKLNLRVDHTDDDTLITDLITTAREWCEDFQGRAYVTQIRELVFDDWPTGDCIELSYPPLQTVESIKYTDSDNVQATWDSSEYIVNKARMMGLVVLGYGESWPRATLLPSGAVVARFTAGYATPFTADIATDTLTATDHPYANGDRIRLSNSGGSLPGGLVDTRDYYAVTVSGDTLQLSLTSGGAAINITTMGTGTHFLGVVPKRVKQAMKLLIGHWYENRELYVVGTIANKLEKTVEDLLWQDRVTMGVG